MKLTTLLAVVSIGALAPASVASAQPQPQGPPPPCVDAAGIQFVCGQQGPEDLVVVPGGAWVVASAFGGSGGINLIRVTDRTTTKIYPSASARDQLDAKTYGKCPGPPDASKFASHGLSLLPGRGNVHRLFVVATARAKRSRFSNSTHGRGHQHSSGSAVPSLRIQSA